MLAHLLGGCLREPIKPTENEGWRESFPSGCGGLETCWRTVLYWRIWIHSLWLDASRPCSLPPWQRSRAPQTCSNQIWQTESRDHRSTQKFSSFRASAASRKPSFTELSVKRRSSLWFWAEKSVHRNLHARCLTQEPNGCLKKSNSQAIKGE